MSMPHGYRWIVEEDFDRSEAEQSLFRPHDGGTIVPWDCMVEFGFDHDHDAEKCEQRIARLGYQEDFDNEQAWTSDHWM